MLPPPRPIETAMADLCSRGADVLVNLPDLGYVKLGSGYLLYEVPDFIAVGGSADANQQLV